MAVPFTLVRMAVHTGLAKWLPAVRKRLGPSVQSLHYLSDRILATPLHQIDDVVRWQSLADGRVMDCSGLPPWTVPSRPSPAMRHDGDCPPTGLPMLRERLTDLLSREIGMSFEVANETLITSGGRGAVHVISDTFLNRRDRVVLFDPCSPLFVDAIRHRRATIRWVPTETIDGKLNVDEDVMRKSLAGAKMVFLSYPAGPTGGYWSESMLDAFVRCANRFDVLVVWDRSLTRWSCEPLPSEFPWLTALRKRVLVVQRLAAGVGAIVGPAGLLQPCCLTSNQMVAPVPSALQQLAIAQIGDPEPDSVRDGRASLRDDVTQRINEMRLKCVRPSCGPFVWFDVNATKLTGRAFCQRLAQEGVLLMPGDRCGPSGRNFVRMTWSGDEGRLREGMRRTEESVNNLLNKITVTGQQHASLHPQELV